MILKPKNLKRLTVKSGILVKKLNSIGDIASTVSILNAKPALTTSDLGDYMQCCSHAQDFDKAKEGWRNILFAYGKAEAPVHPEWIRKLRPLVSQIPHDSIFCIYLDAIGFSDDPLDKLISEWKFIEDWHTQACRKFKTNTCTSYIEALSRKQAYENATNFLLGTQDEKNVVKKYKIELDEKLLRTYLLFQKNIYKDLRFPIQRIRKKWPKLEIDLTKII